MPHIHPTSSLPTEVKKRKKKRKKRRHTALIIQHQEHEVYIHMAAHVDVVFLMLTWPIVNHGNLYTLTFFVHQKGKMASCLQQIMNYRHFMLSLIRHMFTRAYV